MRDGYRQLSIYIQLARLCWPCWLLLHDLSKVTHTPHFFWSVAASLRSLTHSHGVMALIKGHAEFFPPPPPLTGTLRWLWVTSCFYYKNTVKTNLTGVTHTHFPINRLFFNGPLFPTSAIKAQLGVSDPRGGPTVITSTHAAPSLNPLPFNLSHWPLGRISPVSLPACLILFCSFTNLF